MPPVYDVFLSYNNRDREAVRQAHEALKRHNLQPWIDFEALTPGRLWQEEAEEAIRGCRAAAVFLGPLGIGPWENVEMRTLLTRAAQEGLRLIPVFLPGAPERPELPGFLAEFNSVDLRGGIDEDGINRLIRGIPGRKKKVPPKLLHNLPYPPLGDLLKGRNDELRALAESLKESGRAAVLVQAQAIHGLGGIGKTRLAVEYAWRFGTRYKAAFFVRADSPEVLRTGLARLARRDLLNLPEQRVQSEEEIFGAVLCWLRDNSDWLLILDNVETTEAELAVVDLLASLAGGDVLITSRRRSWPAGVHRQQLGTISVEEAQAFLLKRTENDRLPAADDAVQARLLAERLDGLPLALEQAGAYICHTRLSFAGYLAAWEREHDQVLAWYDESTMRYPRSVAVTWQRSFERLGPTAAAILRLSAFLAPEPIPIEMFEAEQESVQATAGMLAAETGQELGPVAIRDAVAELESYSLITSQGTTFTVHRVVQEVLQSRIPAERQRDWIEAALKIVDGYSPDTPSDVRTWPVWNLLRPHAKLITRTADEAGIARPTARLLNELALLLQAKSLFKEAEPLMRRALTLAEAAFRNDHPNVAIALNNLAQLLQDTNRLSEAEPLMRRALAIDEAYFGNDHPNVARHLNNLAQLLQDTNRLSEAEPLMRRALAIDEAAFGNNHPKVAIRLNNLAQLLKDTGRSSGAEPLMRRALAIDEAFFGKDYPKVAIRLNNLAQLLRDTNHSEAELMMRRVLAIHEAAFGNDHPNVAIALNNLAQLLQDTNRLSEAEPLMRKALAIDEAAFGSDHPKVAIRLNNLAQLLQDTNRLSEAEPLMRRSVDIKERGLGPDHPSTRLGQKNLALLLEEIKSHRDQGVKPGRRRAAGAAPLGKRFP